MQKELLKIAQKLDKKYPQGKNPFMIMTRLLEESGELAQEVAHHEATGMKMAKLGEPSRLEMAKEAADVMQVVTQLMIYYDLEAEVTEVLQKRSQDDCEISGQDW